MASAARRLSKIGGDGAYKLTAAARPAQGSKFNVSLVVGMC